MPLLFFAFAQGQAFRFVGEGWKRHPFAKHRPMAAWGKRYSGQPDPVLLFYTGAPQKYFFRNVDEVNGCFLYKRRLTVMKPYYI